jgi:hypothetical protein
MRLVYFLPILLSTTAAVGAEPNLVTVPQPIPPLFGPLQPPSPRAAEQPPQNETGTPQQPPTAEQSGTENNPAIVRALPSEKTAEERAQQKADHDEKAADDWRMFILTGALVGVGILQFLALIGQAIVFGIQAKRLRESVGLTRDIANRQEADMRASITEAGRAAVAMERVADGIGTSVETTAKMAADQREFWQQQMRAYLAIITGGYVPQDRTTGWKLEVRMFVQNNGLTPAHAVAVSSRARILPFPLPEDVDLSLPVYRQEAAGHIGPRQNFFFRAWLDDLLSDEELTTIMTKETPKLYVYGTVYYRDVFGNDYYTNFCQFCLWDVKGNISTNNVPRHNDAT